MVPPIDVVVSVEVTVTDATVVSGAVVSPPPPQDITAATVAVAAIRRARAEVMRILVDHDLSAHAHVVRALIVVGAGCGERTAHVAGHSVRDVGRRAGGG